MVQVIGIAGSPGSGKSSIVKAILAHYPLVRIPVLGARVTGEMRDGLIVLGSYPVDHPAPGSDRFPPDSQNDIAAIVRMLSKAAEYDGWTIIFEGRIASDKGLRAYIDNISPSVWYRLNRTGIANRRKAGSWEIPLDNITPADFKRAVDEIRWLIEGYRRATVPATQKDVQRGVTDEEDGA